ncbi:uncharacterized protein J3D65DRAFT_286223 [Phyllosticta citribraziliensis]|uniref:Uncharacterized protein n=1 Tax=Phyllosticta citribraziliensis TaxID=989973 RepID=A0ABR1LYI9_9PEZI
MAHFHHPTGLFYTCLEFRRIFVGHFRVLPLWYESHGSDAGSGAMGRIYAGTLSKEAFEISDQLAKHVSLVEPFEDIKLDSMEDRNSAYKNFELAYRLIFPTQRPLKRSLSPDSEPETAEKRRRVADENVLTERPRDIFNRNKVCLVLRLRLFSLINATIDTLDWINNFLQTKPERLVKVFDGSPLSTFEDIPPMQYDIVSLVRLAFASQPHGNFDMLQKSVQYASFMPCLEIIQGLRSPVGRVLFLVQDMINQTCMPTLAANREKLLERLDVARACSQKLMEQCQKLGKHQYDVLNPFWE